MLACAGCLCMASAVAQADQASATFNVTVKQVTGTPASAFCRRSNAAGSFGATVTVVCATGSVVNLSPPQAGTSWAPAHGGAYRFVTLLSGTGKFLGTLDTYTGAGTVTAWQIVSRDERDYLELTIGW